jgi:hypothetical protein
MMIKATNTNTVRYEEIPHQVHILVSALQGNCIAVTQNNGVGIQPAQSTPECHDIPATIEHSNGQRCCINHDT